MAQQLRPGRGQRQVQHEQQQVADEQARDQCPDEIPFALQQQRSGLDAEGRQRGQHDGGCGVRRQAERQHRHHGPGRARVVGGLGTGDTLDGTPPELLGMLAELLLGDVGEEGRQLRAARWDDAERESERRPP